MGDVQTEAGSVAADPAAQSSGDLVKQLTEHTSRLVRDEILLAQAELRQKGKQAGVSAGLFGGGGVVALYGGGAIVAGLVLLLAQGVTAWAAALIIGAALVVVAAVMALVGKQRMARAVPPIPTEAAASIREDVAAVKERIHR